MGPNTLAVLEEELGNVTRELFSPGLESMTEPSDRLPFARVEADSYGKGYHRFYLRADVVDAYKRVRDMVLEAGGMLTSSGAKRSLNAKVGPARNATSFHYTGRALDLFIGSGMENPKKDPYVLERVEERRFRVFARAPGGQSRELHAVTYKKRNKPTRVKDKFIDLTALFESEGFKPIRARRSFFNGGSYLGAEWWHFQYEVGLIPRVTTFGSELLQVYSEQTLMPTPPWGYRDRVFRINWF